jgi:hypothetical protein
LGTSQEVEYPMTRRVQTPETHRHTRAARPRPDEERVTLAPLTYEQAVRGLFSVKPDEDDEEPEASDGD